ncbi:MAG TPA: ThiF family adenylyltransferase [Tepidisphaeraceae bacterium]|jgi:adenylyltransferase/sulfurtransferase|nr:ThiF family adenylyltransferase [Tepidisphaeraceae bacterium]
MNVDRYHRQSLLPQIGLTGQQRIAASRVLLVGCGALGTVVADYLARAGVGHLTIVDRDVVESTNLQRQTLFDEADVAAGTPKAVAAVERLRRVNSAVSLEPVVADVHQDNIESLAGVACDGQRVDLIVDGTDNAETRYLVNDVAVKHGLPWVYGAAVGVEGRVMAIEPQRTACLRCVFPEAPGPGELQTCDTAGVLGPVAGVVASLQAATALRMLVGGGATNELVTIDAWSLRLRSVSTVDAKRPECPACGQRHFEFLDATSPATTVLCGRDSVQLRPRAAVKVDLAAVAAQWRSLGVVSQTPFLLRFSPRGLEPDQLTLFNDGRVIVHGTSDPGRARTLVARFFGG